MSFQISADDIRIHGKALQLFQAGAVTKSKTSDDMYHVRSQKDATIEYEVIPSLGVCTCIDFERNGLACKHVMAVQIYRTNQIATTVAAAKIQVLSKIGVVS